MEEEDVVGEVVDCEEEVSGGRGRGEGKDVLQIKFLVK